MNHFQFCAGWLENEGMNKCMHALMYVCMYVCMYACMYVCMYPDSNLLDASSSKPVSWRPEPGRLLPGHPGDDPQPAPQRLAKHQRTACKLPAFLWALVMGPWDSGGILYMAGNGYIRIPVQGTSSGSCRNLISRAPKARLGSQSLLVLEGPSIVGTL